MGNIKSKKMKESTELQKNDHQIVNIEKIYWDSPEIVGICKSLSFMIKYAGYDSAFSRLKGYDAIIIGCIITYAACNNMLELVLLITENFNFNFSNAYKEKLENVRRLINGCDLLKKSLKHPDFQLFQALTFFSMVDVNGSTILNNSLELFYSLLMQYVQPKERRRPEDFVEYEKILNFIWAEKGFQKYKRSFDLLLQHPLHITILTCNQKWFNLLLPETLRCSTRERVIFEALFFCRFETPLEMWKPLLETICQKINNIPVEGKVTILRCIFKRKRKDVLSDSTIGSNLSDFVTLNELFKGHFYEIIEGLMDYEWFMMCLSLYRDRISKLMIEHGKLNLLDKFNEFTKTNERYAKYRGIVSNNNNNIEVGLIEGNEGANISISKLG